MTASISNNYGSLAPLPSGLHKYSSSGYLAALPSDLEKQASMQLLGSLGSSAIDYIMQNPYVIQGLTAAKPYYDSTMQAIMDFLKRNPDIGYGVDKVKGFLTGFTDEQLEAAGKLKDIRNVVTRSGMSVPAYNNAITLASRNAVDLSKLKFFPLSNVKNNLPKVYSNAGVKNAINSVSRAVPTKLIPGTKILGEGLQHTIGTPDSIFDSGGLKGNLKHLKWINPLNWLTGGSENINLTKARFAQGGIFGEGGLLLGNAAVSPKYKFNLESLKAGKRLLPDMNRSWNPTKWDAGSILGTLAGGAAREAALYSAYAAPAYGLYKALNRSPGDTRSFTQRVGGSIGSTIGGSLPLGSLRSSLLATAAPLITSNSKVLGATKLLSPGTAGEYAGEFIGSLGNPRKFNPAEYQMQQRMRMMRDTLQPQLPYGIRGMERSSYQRPNPYYYPNPYYSGYRPNYSYSYSY